MDIDFMREYIAFSRLMNFSRAAKQLHISQPTLSNHIAAIEAEVGALLVDRSTPLRLTQAGRVFLENASGVVDAYDRAIEMARAVGQVELPLVITSSGDSNCSGCAFAQSITGFLADHRNIFFSQMQSVAGTAFDELQRDGVDAVMVCYRSQEVDREKGVAFLELKPTFPNRLGVWMDSCHPLAGKDKLHWSDLNGQKFPMGITVELWASGVIQMLKDHGLSFETSIVSQPGISFLSAYEPDEIIIMDETLAALPFISAPGRCFRLLDEPDACAKTFIAYLPEKVSPALRLYLDYLETA